MNITILKNNVRIASYQYKNSKGKSKTLKSLKAFYGALYSGKDIKLEYIIGA